MPVDLSGRVALVTGASRGIGAAVAHAFSEAGAAVALIARNADALNGVASSIEASGGHALAVPADVSDQEAIFLAVEATERTFGRLDFACNNASGKGHAPTPLAEVPFEAFDSGLETTLRGVFLSMRSEIPAILRAGGGAIVNVSSTAGLQGVGGLAAYCTAKHGLQGLTKVAALDYADRGIRVNAIAPSAILTDNLIRAGERHRRRLRRACR
jgi:NAD(P)-dependent dehydrogenase (short-subunit alcohol dehydrogenase family)